MEIKLLTKSLKQSLRKVCNARIEDFRVLGDVTDTKDGQLVYIDRGCDTLGVAHLDWVDFVPVHFEKNKVYCPQLDDRLGAWVLLYLLPYLDVDCDILLTDNEEIGRSTAKYFEPPREYNWMFEFDRRGTDVVMYEYDSPSNRQLLDMAGFEVGHGSFSDISYLGHLGITGFNFGVGYHHEHSRRCYANLIDTLNQANKFAEFWQAFHNMPIPAPDYFEDDAPYTKDDFNYWPHDDTLCRDCGYPINIEDTYCNECGVCIWETH